MAVLALAAATLPGVVLCGTTSVRQNQNNFMRRLRIPEGLGAGALRGRRSASDGDEQEVDKRSFRNIMLR